MQTDTVAHTITTLEKKPRRRRERGQGGLVKKAGSKCWYLLYYDLSGKQRSESSGTTVKSNAQKLLTSRLESVRRGELVDVRKLRYEGIRAILIADYKSTGKLTEREGEILAAGRKGLFKPLDSFFGGMAVHSITTDKLREFVAQRKAAGVSGPTCNRNLTVLRRMFMLAKRENKIQNVPFFPMEQESPARQGFVEQKDFQMLRDALPEHLRPFVTFLYQTGCRTGAAKQIRWEWVNLDAGIIELPAGVTKNKEALTLPLSSELVGMLKKLFRVDSKPVFDTCNFKKAWSAACVKVGLATQDGYAYRGLIPHDLRRSAVRNMRRAGIDQSVAMSISGHKTISVFQRYNIIDTADKLAAMSKVEKFNASVMQVEPSNAK
jgi:integrase